MSRYSEERVQREGEGLIELRNSVTGAMAVVWPGLGNNCFEARLPVLARDGGNHSHLSTSVETLLAPPSLAELRKRPALWGIPLLFPYPSRVPRGEYEFEGRHYRMPRDFHGFALDAAWRLVSIDAEEDMARVEGVLSSDDHPVTLEGFPFPYRVEATHTLNGGGLRLDVRVTNTGGGNMPFGYGAHPYFRLPLGDRGVFGECVIRVPAARKWNVPLTTAVSDGAPAPWDTLCQAVGSTPEAHDLHGPLPLVEKKYNGVYTDLELVEGLVECSVTDPVNGLEAVMRATPNHGVVVVYTHPGSSSVCFEPWTCPPNVFNLASHNVKQNGLVVLAPGEAWAGTMWLSVRMPATP